MLSSTAPPNGAAVAPSTCANALASIISARMSASVSGSKRYTCPATRAGRGASRARGMTRCVARLTASMSKSG
eukprot:16126106-Heterocapsa_arctica.AAC.1